MLLKNENDYGFFCALVFASRTFASLIPPKAKALGPSRYQARVLRVLESNTTRA